MKRALITVLTSLVLMSPLAEASDNWCFGLAADRYGVSERLLKAIAIVESGMRQNIINVSNSNGTIDVCHMQINSYWAEILGDRWFYLSDPCYCTMVGAWILRQCVDRYGQGWDAVACYHTGRPLERAKKPGQRYVNRIKRVLQEKERGCAATDSKR